jgi:transmembrane serine protease 2
LSAEKSLASPRIIGGQNAGPTQFPWQVRLEYPSGGLLCGGSILSNRLIVTAAHCFCHGGGHLAVTSVTVLIGAINYVNPPVGSSVQRFVVGPSNIICHKRYNAITKENDIALICLDRSIVFNAMVRPISLPIPGKLYAGSAGIVSGWGRTVAGDANSQSAVLQFTTLDITTNVFCQPTFLAIIGPLQPSMVCAIDSASSACKGDSGGPLAVMESDGTFHLVGVTSFGITGCPTGVPGVYTRVSSFIPWICKNKAVRCAKPHICRCTKYSFFVKHKKLCRGYNLYFPRLNGNRRRA